MNRRGVSADSSSVHRLFASAFAALAVSLVVGLTATPAAASETVSVVVGAPDGTFEVVDVPAVGLADRLAEFRATPGVAWAELDTKVQAVEVEPDDDLWDEQWGPRLVGAPEAWEHTTGDPSVLIAVLDTGVDAGHPDLSGGVATGYDFVDDDNDPDDPHGHGTAVAGIIAARGDNGRGIAGYCWECRILPVRVLDEDGFGDASTVSSGLRWAVDQGADVINLSLAGPDTSQALASSVAYARMNGAIVVAAAGNQTESGQNLTARQYPAATSGVVAVAGVDERDDIESWSFRGSWVDVAAPGCVSTTVPGGSYTDGCGTSFASPAVAGILGLARSLAPAVPAIDIEAALLETAVSIGSSVEGGRIDAAALLDSVGPLPTVSSNRVAGANRVATAVALSERAHRSATTVVVARADSYADALAAAPLAGQLDAPVLLTGSGALDAAVAGEIRRLGATSARVIGGTGALGTAVETGLRDDGVSDVRRVAGTSRYDTARLIAESVGGTSVYIAQASSWPDAVAVSGLAALTGRPILLVDRATVPGATAQALSTLGATSATIVGGTGAVDEAVAGTLRTSGLTVSRLAGSTRYATSAAVADAALVAGGDPSTTWIATGRDWPDALAAGPAAAASGAVLLLVDGRSGSGPSSAWLADNADAVLVVGGAASITDEVVGSLL